MQIGIGIDLSPTSGGEEVSYSAEATALFARMTAQPDATRKGHIDTLIGALKTAGVWTKLDVFYMFAALDIQSSLLNWKSSSYDCTRVNLADGSFTVDRGWTTDGSTSYIDTGFNPSTAGGIYALNSASFGTRNLIDNNTTASGFGNFDGTNGCTLNPRNSGNYVWRVNSSAGVNTAGAASSIHVYQLSRSASNALDLIIDGTPTANTNASTSIGNLTFRIGTATATAARAVQAAWFYAGGDLTRTEEGDLRTASATFTTALGF